MIGRFRINIEGKMPVFTKISYNNAFIDVNTKIY